MSHSEIVLELMNKEVSTVQIIKDMYQAFNLSEAKTKQIIYNIINERGDCVAYKGESDLLYVEQKQAIGPYFESAPELKTNNHKAFFTGWVSSIMEHRATYISVINQVNWMFGSNNSESHTTGGVKNISAPPINFTHLWVTRDTNENTNRA